VVAPEPFGIGAEADHETHKLTLGIANNGVCRRRVRERF
jgi:hypothetical protein